MHGAIQTIQEALALVRGKPFTTNGRRSQAWRSFAWASTEVDEYDIEHNVVKAAAQLAQLCLQVGDPEGARWTARRGRLVSPFSEQLFRAEMQAAFDAGDFDAEDFLYDELCRLISDNELGTGEASPETAALYAEHLRARRATS